MRWENIKDALGLKRNSIQNQVKEIDTRPLSKREESWIRDILQVNPDWAKADMTKTRVIAEGPNAEGYSIILKAPTPENPLLDYRREMVGQLWIQTDDQSTANVQLSQFQGNLQELYVLFIDNEGRNRTLPETWNEVSREAVDF